MANVTTITSQSASSNPAASAAQPGGAAALTDLIVGLPDRLGIGQSIPPRVRRQMGNLHATPIEAIAYALQVAEVGGSVVRFDRDAVRHFLNEEARLRPIIDALAAVQARLDGHLLSLRALPSKQTLGLLGGLKLQAAVDPTAETTVTLEALRDRIPIARRRGSRMKKIVGPLKPGG